MDNKIDIAKLIDYIFSKNNPQPNSIQVSFIEENENDDIESLFEIILTVFTEGMKKFYGQNINGNIIVDLEKLQDKDFQKINTYMNSFGINCTYKAFSNDEVIEQSIVINKKVLSDYIFTIKCKNFTYSIIFDYLLVK